MNFLWLLAGVAIMLLFPALSLIRDGYKQDNILWRRSGKRVAIACTVYLVALGLYTLLR